MNLRFPEFGARRMSKVLERFGIILGRSGVGRIMELMGLEAIFRKPRTRLGAPGRPKYLYLLSDHVVTEPDEAWCADVTYIPMARGFAYLVVVMGWHTRAVLSWRLSNRLDGAFCAGAFYAAVQLAGKAPEIFNTDQGCQFTAKAWLEAVEGSGAKASMDRKGRWMDNMFVERLWRSVKHERVYLWAHETVQELEKVLAKWFEDYNRWKPHQALGYKTPWECYRPKEIPPWKKVA
jgi:putative transposase